MVSSILDQIRKTEEGKVEYTPYVQVLQGSGFDPEGYGLFIQKSEAEKVGFKPDTRWQEYFHKFQGSKETTPGYISYAPRLVVVRSTKLEMVDRSTGKFVGYYEKDAYKPAYHALRTRYLLFLIGEDNSLLHTQPLQFTAKGTFGASFGSAYGKYKKAFCSLLGQQRTGEFWNYVVFDFEISPEEKGATPATKKVCSSVTRFVHPTDKTLPKLYLAFDEKVKETIKNAYIENEKFGEYSQNTSEENKGIEAVKTDVANQWRNKILGDLVETVRDDGIEIDEAEARASIFPADIPY